jgi:hypothetical protein
MRTLLLLALCVGAASAQPAAVDGELAFALLGIDDAEALAVGTAPDSLRPLLPEGATVLGTLRRDVGIGGRGTVTVLGRLDESPEEVAAAYARNAPDGWTSYSPERFSEPAGGFASSTSGTAGRSFQYYAGEDAERVAQVSVIGRPAGGAYVRVHQRWRHPLETNPHRGRAERPAWVDALEGSLPLLTAPEGDVQRRTGGGGGPDDDSSEADLRTDRPLAEVLTHIGGQMAEGGWTPGSHVSVGEVGTSSWVREWEGKSLAAMLYVRREAADRYALRIHVLGPDR